MNTIGTIKNKVLAKLSNAYSSGNKKEMKEIIGLLKENKDFRELYLMYEEFETKYFEDESIAKLYVDEIVPILKEQYTENLSFIKKLNEKLGDVEYEKNELYENLDLLLSRRTIRNIDSQLLAKQSLIKHLTTKKEEKQGSKTPLVMNENLFYALLANNYNVLYENTLSNDEKSVLKTYMDMNDNEIVNNVVQIKESILSKISSLLNESNDATLATKLEDVKTEVNRLTPTKYNLYRLEQLKNGLI